jgi:hypothetical protein
MCYSNGYKYSDGDIQSFSTGLSIQLAACDTSREMKGGKKKRMTKRNRKRNRKRKGKSKVKRSYKI